MRDDMLVNCSDYEKEKKDFCAALRIGVAALANESDDVILKCNYEQFQGWLIAKSSAVVVAKTPDPTDFVTLAYSSYLNAVVGARGISDEIANDFFVNSSIGKIEVYVGKKLEFTSLAAFMEFSCSMKSEIEHMVARNIESGS